MSWLKLYLFGPPRLEREDQPVNMRRRKALALAAYLAISGQPHSREALGTLFWSDQDPPSARTNLRRGLSRLNKLLGPKQLTIEREQVILSEAADLWVDVIRFQDLLARSHQHQHPTGTICPACLSCLNEAVTLYTHDFLAGFTIAGSPDFDEWQFFQTETLRRQLATALEQLIHMNSYPQYSG